MEKTLENNTLLRELCGEKLFQCKGLLEERTESERGMLPSFQCCEDALRQKLRGRASSCTVRAK